MYELILAEKPKAAFRIASALSEKDVEKKSYLNVPYYIIKRKNKEIVIASAVGHLFTLAEKDSNGWNYPVFNVEWKPTYEVNKTSSFSKKYLSLLKKLVKEANEFTIATDYDIEGEVIGLNVMRFIFKQKDANRMKFSTLTKDELISSYEDKTNHIDWGQAKAGEVRHELDWYWGINLTRALTQAVKSTGAFQILSSGRVQGPTLKLIVDKERSIKSFIPKKYWNVFLCGDIGKSYIEATHIKERFDKKDEAINVVNKCKGNDGVVKDIVRKQKNIPPPFPFDLTSLQMESYKVFRISPKETLQIAQELYLLGLISYPRTSSQKLPSKIGYKKILSLLNKMGYDCSTILSKKVLKPNEGKKIDPAHPAIYPTGLSSDKVSERSKKVYDLIVRRFISTFGDNAVIENIKIIIDCNNEEFVFKDSNVIDKGWMDLYKYTKIKQGILDFSNINKGDIFKVKDIKMIEKETEPPRRYTQASIIRELEKKGLGTKATRAAIVDILYKRNYVRNDPIEATELGVKIIETLEKFSPEVIDANLTKYFENELEMIRENKKNPGNVLDEAKNILTEILNKFKKKEKEIGNELREARNAALKSATIVGKCSCGGNLIIIKSKKGKQFVACDNRECDITYPLPQGKIVPTGKICKHCGTPIVKVIRKGKRPFEMCLDVNCVTKKEWKKRWDERRKKQEEEKNKKIIKEKKEIKKKRRKNKKKKSKKE